MIMVHISNAAQSSGGTSTRKTKIMQARCNKAKNDKTSILADVKNLLVVLHPAIQRMPKIERIEGAPQEMKRACYGIIHHFTAAKECPEERLTEIKHMFGCFGELLAAFDLCISFGLLTDSDKLRIAIQLERIEEGVRKWRNATRSPCRQDRQEVTAKNAEELAGSCEESKREYGYHL